MFKRSSNASILKDKNKIIDSEEKPDRKIISLGADNAPSSTSVHSPRNEKTIIGEGVVIEGKISGKGNLIIEGSMKGDVELEGNSITVGPKGRIAGDIIAKDAIISGRPTSKPGESIYNHPQIC